MLRYVGGFLFTVHSSTTAPIRHHRRLVVAVESSSTPFLIDDLVT